MKALKGGLLSYPTVREALLYERMAGGKVRCGLCERRCLIGLEDRGLCGTRMNVDGRLYTLVYGDINALESRPIEIKPFFHYWPGSTALTFSTWSCNFHCPWCQNWQLSKTEPSLEKANYVSAEDMVYMAIRGRDEGLCVSFTEPTLLFEASLEYFKLSRGRGLYNCYVSNGYMTLEALRLLAEAGMDAIKIDLKGDVEAYRKYCGGVDVNLVWRNAKEAKGLGLHVEVVNLVVTGVGDDDECLRWVIEKHLKEVGPETPLHFTRYYPAFKFKNPSTNIETLEKAYEMAKKAGVLYPYIGNVAGHKYENTYCHNCRELLIKRFSYSILNYKITEGKKCPKCNVEIPITGRYIKKLRLPL